ncbi:GIY-YIG nuclease family protein [Halorientalis pallida]|uniref:GIY-YIG nuclease family protein n=1 Tax=Halorientalis pallida TaxID=2479928 RepID=A0A498L852_9EURY|nr:GIY-YIG nuclease family protein [Halorientalis pallida]RXK51955.1 GIY-YIG nuclease family protein [Halorientalis pallida]
MVEGTYTIVVNLPEPETLTVGSLGRQDVPAGYYAYTGSAFGPGGFKRVDRHHELAVGERETRHWHIDYLLGDTAARIETVARSPEAEIECAVAAEIAETVSGVVEGFGASDCDCPAHLYHHADREELVAAVRDAHDRHG